MTVNWDEQPPARPHVPNAGITTLIVPLVVLLTVNPPEPSVPQVKVVVNPVFEQLIVLIARPGGCAVELVMDTP
jgi:hypothetical protein